MFHLTKPHKEDIRNMLFSARFDLANEERPLGEAKIAAAAGFVCPWFATNVSGLWFCWNHFRQRAHTGVRYQHCSD